MKERIVISSDHAGFELKVAVKALLEELGYETEDVGTYSTEPVDYPIYTYKAAQKVSCGEYSRGIICCGTGQGDAIAANKVPGVRAALIQDHFSAHQGVEDDNMNILCLGGRLVGYALAEELVQTFLNARFSGAERHQRRLAKVAALEKQS